MSSSFDTVHASSSSSSRPFHVSGSTGTSTRNHLNASLGKQHFHLAESSKSPSKSLFDAVPRNADFDSLKPILARLPLEFDDDDDDDQDAADSANSLDYVVKKGGLVMYTRSRLPFLDSLSVDLWRSLHHFQPLTADYASGYLDPTPPHPLPSGSFSSCPAFTSASTRALSHLRTSFNWSLLPPLPPSPSKQCWYGVLFLSQRKPGSESTSFYEADRLAHEEATRSGGLIMYWYGAPHPSTGANLATCIWTSRTAAVQASKLPLHHKAARFAGPSYERYDLVRYKVCKWPGEGRLRIEAWTEEDDREEQLGLQ